MKNKYKDIMVISTAVLILVLCFFVIQISSHEQSHVEINRIYGCKSNIEFFLNNKTHGIRTLGNCTLPSQEMIVAKSLHAQNELNYYNIIYNTTVVFLLLCMSGMNLYKLINKKW